MNNFWNRKSILNFILLPLSLVWLAVTYFRLKKKPQRLPLLVICVGNISVGGGGKTPFAIYLYGLLQQLNIRAAILSKGYKGNFKSAALLVDSQKHTAKMVGDEPLLLSKYAPVVVAKNRIDGGNLIQKLGFKAIIMDDGLQNPSLFKDLNFLLINTLNPSGNNLIIPAGPLREPFMLAKRRINLAFGEGELKQDWKQKLDSAKIKYLAYQVAIGYGKANYSHANKKQKYFAFAAIADPKKFLKTLNSNGFEVINTKWFSDHYTYTEKDLQWLVAQAKNQNLCLITTSKDYVKIPANYKSLVTELPITISLTKDNEDFLKQYLQTSYLNHLKSPK